VIQSVGNTLLGGERVGVGGLPGGGSWGGFTMVLEI
jgi:hypothetical protein